MLPVFLFCLASCSFQPEPEQELHSLDLDITHDQLSEVIATLQDETVSGYVLVHKSDLEYSSLEKARSDTSVAKSVVQFETKEFRLHTPESEKDWKYYHWGSPLVCRKVIKDHGDVVEVQTLDTAYDVPQKLGHGGLGADYMFELTTFVRKKDLVPVLKKPYQLSFPDQTSLQLDAGVAVGIPWNSDGTKRAVSIQQLHFEFPIPDSLLALSYQPKLRKLENLEGKLMLDETAHLFLGGEKFCPVAQLRLDWSRTPLKHRIIGDFTMVELVSNGIQLNVMTDKELVKPYIPNIDRPVLTPKFKTPPRWYYRIHEGTPVYWDDGRLAGKVVQYFGHYSKVAPGDTHLCEIMSELFLEEPLCFKLEDIEVVDNG